MSTPAAQRSVDQLMSDQETAVSPDDTLDRVHERLRSARSRHASVAAAGKLVGFLSTRDVFSAEPRSTDTRPGERLESLRRQRVAEVMSSGPPSLGRGDGLVRAATLLLAHRLSSLPVVDAEQNLVGFLTTIDLLRAIAEALRAEASRGTPIPVERLMTPRPLTIQAFERLDVAEILMAACSARHLPVLVGRRLVGMLSDRDVLCALSPELEILSAADRARRGALVAAGQAMTPNPLTIARDAPAHEAAERLVGHRIGSLPVLSGSELVGIVTERDFLRWFVATCGVREELRLAGAERYAARG